MLEKQEKKNRKQVKTFNKFGFDFLRQPIKPGHVQSPVQSTNKLNSRWWYGWADCEPPQLAPSDGTVPDVKA